VDTPQQEQELHRNNRIFFFLFLSGYPIVGTGTPLKQQEIFHPVPKWIPHSRNRNSTERGDITSCS
jgi:hypothetical protein